MRFFDIVGCETGGEEIIGAPIKLRRGPAPARGLTADQLWALVQAARTPQDLRIAAQRFNDASARELSPGNPSRIDDDYLSARFQRGDRTFVLWLLTEQGYLPRATVTFTDWAALEKILTLLGGGERNPLAIGFPNEPRPFSIAYGKR